ncbi:hybrid sensor histidine kinase/response regulator [Romeria aff. gracilis LEGE 07310]|uniref:histidine kinase n=1 Tax=Vasconcelosia minhoensis LEGE 07310 TaxID=915328 RepID=A0A8J7A8D3_9CYAN|nr:hybrid sensor histidine kinase/response regulator [Romeria gracilis]MBE9079007.1 hybrid sensor histidine kinase/response regulator [Romeria aff. gracilis LEGE 07310]
MIADRSIQKFNILAVDDAPDNLFLLESILDDHDGYQLNCVENGREALSKIHQSPPDLVLLDVMMPELDGYEVTRRVRQDQSLPYIPILLITAHDESSVVEGLDAGADDFIRKPVEVNELLARVRSLLRLKRSIDERENMMRQRDDFVARLTHDLRTPLVAANRVLQLCLQGVFGKVPDEMQEVLGNVITNNQNLLQMANTLLEVYRHEAGQKSLSMSRLSLYEVAQEVVQELKALASEKGLALTLVVAGKDDSQLSDEDQAKLAKTYQMQGDRLELRRLTTNLVGNAIKFTDQGHITVRLSTESPLRTAIENPFEVASRWLRLEVEDTGPGISQEDIAEIFGWFRQGDHMRAGSGLGLHLSRRIAEMHKGNLNATSQQGEGSTFTLRLPVLR